MPRDYYEVLGVDRDVDEATLKKSFRKLARTLHPDVNDEPDAEDRFKEAAEAYEVLSDADKRRTYDAYGHDGLRSGGYQPGAEGFGSVQDIFEQFFGGGGGAFGDIFGGGGGGPAGGGDVGLRVEIDLGEVLTGVTREVEFEAVVSCDHCNGNAAEPGTPIVTCETCGGQGQVRRVARTPFGQMMQTGACPDCEGQGKIPEQPCRECNGKGRKLSHKSYEVEIPAGIESGQRIRIRGAGHAGEVGGATGDLFVQVEVRESEDFLREGQDLFTVAELSTVAAMIGTRIEVPTLDADGDASSSEIEIKAGTQHGDTVRLRSEGLPALRGPARGDLHVIVKLQTPVKLDGEQQRLAEQLEDSLTSKNLPKSGSGGIFDRVKKAFR